MTDPLIPQTKLDAVNLMLASIGQTPLNTLDTTGIRDAAIAELTLDLQHRQVLSRGWTFNTDCGYELTPTVGDNILVPSNALNVTSEDDSKDYVERDNGGTRMLYDRDNNTFTITEPVECTIVRAFDFEKIPEAARGYIATRAARIFQANTIASEILFKYTAQHEQEAFATLKRLERRNRKANLFRYANDANAAVHRRYQSSR